MKDFEYFKKRIVEREKAITKEREKEAIVLMDLGQAVHEAGWSDVSEELYSDKAKKAIKAVEDINKEIKLVHENEKRREEIHNERNSLNKELRRLKHKAGDERKEIGRSAWNMWKTGFNIEGLEKALDSLIKAEGRLLSEQDNFQKRHNSESNGNLITKGMDILSSGKQKTISSTMERLLRRAGEKIYTTVNIDAFEDTSVAASISALKSIEERIEEIGKLLDSLADEKKQLFNTSEKSLLPSIFRRHIGQLEKDLEVARKQRDNIYKELGQYWLELKSEDLQDADVEKYKSAWNDIYQNICSMENDKTALEAHRDFMEMDKKCSVLESRIGNLEDELNKKQAKLKTEKKELQSLMKDLAARKENLPPMPVNETLSE